MGDCLGTPDAEGMGFDPDAKGMDFNPDAANGYCQYAPPLGSPIRC